ncbi:hypothetical protein JTB14_033781 [Gonioctena quinquepunctata]|nr:hypothetical protein JTB14_033781 [Gonioctena quinquepunctata]
MDLISQLPIPFIHNTMWGSERTFGRGKMIENVIDNCNINLLNTGSSTYFHVQSGSFSSMDLSISDPETAPLHTWHTLDSLYDGSHFPILISDNELKQVNIKEKWKIAKANWELYSQTLKENTENINYSNDVDEAVEQLTNFMISAANNYIGKYSVNPTKRTVHWWNDSCNIEVKVCKKALNKYRRTRYDSDLINLKKMRAKSKRVLKQSKRESRNKFTSTITFDTSPSQIWTKISRMKGRNTSFRISGLTHEGKVITNDRKIANVLAQHFQNKTKPNLESPNTTNNSHPKQTPYN